MVLPLQPPAKSYGAFNGAQISWKTQLFKMGSLSECVCLSVTDAFFKNNVTNRGQIRLKSWSYTHEVNNIGGDLIDVKGDETAFFTKYSHIRSQIKSLD